jgi:hypothetical protein
LSLGIVTRPISMKLLVLAAILLARDLGGSPAHLAAVRRTREQAFTDPRTTIAAAVAPQ